MGRNRGPIAVAGAIVLACGSAAAQPQAETGQGLEFLPGVRSRITYSDNLLRNEQGDGRSGLITEISPYVRADYRSARTSANVDLTLRNIHRTVGDDQLDLLRPNLRARGNTALVSDWLWLEGAATIVDVNASQFGALSVDPSLNSVNRSRLSSFNLSPYVLGKFGSFADYRLQYSYLTARTTGNQSLLARDDHTLSGALTSGPRFNRWGWSLNSYAQRRSFANGFTMNRQNAVASAYYLFGQELRVGGSLNYDAIDQLTDSSGNTSGWGPGIFADWSPGSRTTIRARLDRPYYGNTGSLSMSHRTQRLAFGLNYARQVFSSNSASILFFNPAALLSGGLPTASNPITQQLITSGLVSDQNSVFGAGVITDALVLSRNLTASVGYTGPRLSSTLTAYRSVRNTLVDTQLGSGQTVSLGSSSVQYNQWGVSLGNSLRLDARSSVNLLGNVMHTGLSNSAQSAKLAMVTAMYQTQMDARTTTSLGLRRAVQSGSGGAVSYDENVVFGTIDLRF